MSGEEAAIVGKAAAMRRLRLEVAGVQAVLKGRLIQDRETLLPRLSRERRAPGADERAFFDLEGRFEDALARLERHASFEQRSAGGSMARLQAIQGSLKEMTSSPVMLGVIETLEQFPDTTVVEDEEGPVSSGGDDQTDTSAPANDPAPPIDVQPWDSYSTEDRAAALGYFEGGTRLLLENETAKITDVVHRAGGLRKPNGDLDWDQINGIISGVIFGAALGVGGAAGGALAAVAFLVVPRMLAAIEDDIGDFLIGDIPDV